MTREEIRKRLGEEKYAEVIEFAETAQAKRNDPDVIAKEVATELRARFPDRSPDILPRILNDVPRSLRTMG